MRNHGRACNLRAWPYIHVQAGRCVNRGPLPSHAPHTSAPPQLLLSGPQLMRGTCMLGKSKTKGADRGHGHWRRVGGHAKLEAPQQHRQRHDRLKKRKLVACTAQTPVKEPLADACIA